MQDQIQKIIRSHKATLSFWIRTSCTEQHFRDYQNYAICGYTWYRAEETTQRSCECLLSNVGLLILMKPWKIFVSKKAHFVRFLNIYRWTKIHSYWKNCQQYYVVKFEGRKQGQTVSYKVTRRFQCNIKKRLEKIVRPKLRFYQILKWDVSYNNHHGLLISNLFVSSLFTSILNQNWVSVTEHY